MLLRLRAVTAVMLTLLLLAIPLLTATPVAAAPFTVTTTADSGAGSLRAAITSANAAPGSTISFAGGLGAITTGSPLTITQPLTITGNGAAATIVQASTTFNVFVVHVPSGTVAFNALTIRNGSGGIVNDFGLASTVTVTVTDAVIASNSNGGINNAPFGAGTATIAVTNTTFTGNGNGGIVNAPNDPAGGPVTVTNSTFSGNGVGINNAPTGTGTTPLSPVTVTNSTFSGNTSEGIFNSPFGTRSPLTVTGTTISGNTNFGILNTPNNGPSPLTLANVTITNNAGTGLQTTPFGALDTVTLTNVTIANNGNNGIYNDPFGTPPPTVTNTIITASTKENCKGKALTDGGHNLEFGGAPSNTCGFVTGAPKFDLLADPQLGPLVNNGGPTQTMALLVGSPAINAGDNTAVTNPPFPGPPSTDQRGAGFPRIANGTVDIGAFEVAGAPPPPPVGGGGGGGTPNCATLTASPNPVPFGSGATDLAWDTCDGSNAEVTVSNNGGPEVDFVASGAPTGHRLTTNPDGQGFIVSGSYIFRLYRAASHTLLAGVIVQKANPKGTTGPAIVAAPSGVPFEAGVVLHQVTIKFDTGDDTPGDVYVSLNNGAQTLFTENVTSPGGSGAPGTAKASKTGAQPADASPNGEVAKWVQSGTYTFTLRSKATGQVLDTATVTTGGGLAASPNPVAGGGNLTGTSTQLTFNTGSGVPGTVCVANASNVSVPNTTSNSGAGISSLNGLVTGSYTAVLYVSASGQAITAVVPGIGGCTGNVPLTPAPGIAPITITVSP